MSSAATPAMIQRLSPRTVTAERELTGVSAISSARSNDESLPPTCEPRLQFVYHVARLMPADSIFSGVFSVLPTPFGPTGELDHESLQRVVDLFIDGGVNGVTALGVTSEVARLSERERGRAFETIMQHVNGRVPVVAGATADGLQICMQYTRHARDSGAAG